MDFKSVVIPERLAVRPRDTRGYPIPFTVIRDAEGKPDFRVTDVKAWVDAVKRRICALCGQPLGGHLAFVGGNLTFKNRLFTDLPMHRACAEYALRVCPFLAAPSFKYAAPEKKRVEGFTVQATALVNTVRPDRFFLGITRDYDIVEGPDGTLLAHAAPWKEAVWWKEGAPIPVGDGDEKIPPIGGT